MNGSPFNESGNSSLDRWGVGSLGLHPANIEIYSDVAIAAGGFDWNYVGGCHVVSGLPGEHCEGPTKIPMLTAIRIRKGDSIDLKHLNGKYRAFPDNDSVSAFVEALKY